MANSPTLAAFPPDRPSSRPSSRAELQSSPASSSADILAAALPGQRVRILHIAQEAELAAWLRAVGLHEESEVTVLRRAAFGGPLHLRSSDGGEFAIHRDLARCIRVVHAAEVSPSQPPASSPPSNLESTA